MWIFQKTKELLAVGQRVGNLFSKVNFLTERVQQLEAANEDLKIICAKIYDQLLKQQSSENIHDFEFKVFSQYGDDGIIQFLIRKLPITEKTFVEFGVENYTESNTRFLLLNNNWTGLVIDGSAENINYIKSGNLYWRQNLTAVNKFVTKHNINDLLTSNGFKGETGILHIDIDGNDYWIWEEINSIQAQVVIMEYNSVFGLNPWTVPYEDSFYRTEKHHSNLYFGASLSALNHLAEKKGYSLIGCNSHGNNAYFVRNDKMNNLKKLTPEEGYVLSQFRESRDKNGNLTFMNGTDRLKAISGLPVYNVVSGKIETIPSQ